MSIAAVIIFAIAIILAITGGLWQAVNWLLWVALVLAIIAVVMFLLRVISGRRA